MIKKILFIFAILLLCTHNSWAAVTLIANTCAGSSNSGASVTTSAINTTGATLIVVAVSYAPAIYGVSTPTDSSSNTYTQINNNAGYNYDTVALYYNSNPTTSSSQTFTENAGSVNYPSICVEAFSGTSISTAYDQQNSLFTNGSYSFNTGSITPTYANELIVATGTNSTASQSISITSPLVYPGSNYQVVGVASEFNSLSMGYYQQTTATAINGQFGADNSNSVGSIASFQQSSGAGSVITTIKNGTIKNATIN